MIESKEADTKTVSQFFVLSEKHFALLPRWTKIENCYRRTERFRNFLLSYSQGSITINSRRTDLLLS